MWCVADVTPLGSADVDAEAQEEKKKEEEEEEEGEKDEPPTPTPQLKQDPGVSPGDVGKAATNRVADRLSRIMQASISTDMVPSCSRA